jgi:hypothetical protein
MSSLLTNSAFVYEPKCGGGGGGLRGHSQWVQLYTGVQINFVYLTPYLTYWWLITNWRQYAGRLSLGSPIHLRKSNLTAGQWTGRYCLYYVHWWKKCPWYFQAGVSADKRWRCSHGDRRHMTAPLQMFWNIFSIFLITWTTNTLHRKF